jgi:hypothetical protein
MYTKLILLVLPLLASTAHARILRWQTSKMSSTTYDISNKNASNTFLNESNWRVVDPVTGTISTKMASPASYDTLQIYGASLTLSVDFDMTALEGVVLDFGEPRNGVSYSLKVKRDNQWFLSSTSKIWVNSGDLVAEKDNLGCINTGILIGGVFKLMAVDCAEVVVRAFTYASQVTPQTVSILQEGFISGTLPVMLSSFEAIRLNDRVVLTWKTNQESNSLHYIVERSADAKKFSPLSQVSGGGTASIEYTYTFTDAQPLKGISYYRIRTVSEDDREALSTIRPVRMAQEHQPLSVYPNPVRQQAYVMLPPSVEKPVQWQLFNTMGQKMRSGNISENNIQYIYLNVSDLRNGHYILSVSYQDATRQQLIVSVAH